MDIQLKRGLLDVCVLAAIKNEDSYGYQIIKDIKPYVEISDSTLYPILRRLEAGQMLTVRSTWRTAPEILPHYGAGTPAAGGISAGVAGDPGNLQIYYKGGTGT